MSAKNTTWWYQHQGNGEFVVVDSTAGTVRYTRDHHFRVTVLENQYADGFIERRVRTEVEEEFTPDMPNEWRDDVVTPDIARERALLILEACDEIDERNHADHWLGPRPVSTGGAAWGPAHVEAMRKRNERVAEWVRAGGMEKVLRKRLD